MTSADGVSKVTTAAFLTSHSISPSIRTSLTPIKKGRQLNTNCTKHFPHPQNKDDNHITPVTTKSSLHLTSPQYPSPHLFLLFTHRLTQYIYRASTHTSQPCTISSCVSFAVRHKARQDIIIIDHKVHHLILMTMVTPEVLIPMIHGVHCASLLSFQ